MKLCAETYTLELRNRDRSSGTNNNAVFDIDWSFLPREHQYYRVEYNEVISVPADSPLAYADNTTTAVYRAVVGVYCDFGCKSLSYSTNTKSTSTFLGFCQRYSENFTINPGGFISKQGNNPLTIVRPDNNTIRVQHFMIKDSTGSIFSPLTTYNGTTTGTDMGSWVISLTFTPLKDDDKEY